MSPSCSIVIRAFNEEKHLGRLLEGVFLQSIKDVQVILVDSGSTDRTIGIAEANDVDIVRIAPQDFTFGRSLNLGIQAANSEIILIASAHVFPVYPDWIEKMIAPFTDPSVALVYGKQRGVKNSRFSERQIYKHWFPDQSQALQDHPFCNNANAAIRRSLWEKNQYDESLPGLEDLAWAKWAQENKFKIIYISQAEIKHVHDESYRGVKKRYLREGMAFKSIYPHEHFSILDLFRLFMRNALSDMTQARKQHNLRKELIGIIMYRWQQFSGTYLGYRRSGPLTWQLRQSFYYPSNDSSHRTHTSHRDVQPINYQKNSDTIE